MDVSMSRGVADITLFFPALSAQADWLQPHS
jgi:hypothetical protein